MSSWTDQDNERVMSDLPLKEIAKVLNRTVDAVRQQRFMLRKYQHISPSPYPKYTEPTQITTDRILVLPDLELPFHNSDFVNRVVDLALSWKVETILAAGDMFHLDALTGWEANWKKVLSQYMDEKTKDRLNEVFMKIKDARVREEAFEAIDDLEPKTGESFGEEIKTAKKVVSELSVFKNKYHIMGNHEGRLLRMVNSSMEGVNISDMFAMRTGSCLSSILRRCSVKINSGSPTQNLTERTLRQRWQVGSCVITSWVIRTTGRFAEIEVESSGRSQWVIVRMKDCSLTKASGTEPIGATPLVP